MHSNKSENFMSCSLIDHDLIFDIFDRSNFYAQKDFFPLGEKTGNIIGGVFLQKSLRTLLSFKRSAIALGCDFVETSSISESSEYFKDELRELIEYSSIYFKSVILRSSLNLTAEKEFKDIFDASPVPIISAGIGSLEHPTAALNLLFCIWGELGRKEGISIAVVSKKSSRVGNSLALLIRKFSSCNICFFSEYPEIIEKNFLVIDPNFTSYKSYNILNYSLDKTNLCEYDVILIDENYSDYNYKATHLEEKGLFFYINEKIDNSLPLILHAKPILKAVGPGLIETVRRLSKKASCRSISTRTAILERLI